MQAHRDSHIKASLWDRENAKATVNVKTCPPSKTHGSPFARPIRDKGALYFSTYKPLDETSGSQRHRGVDESCPSFETTVSKCLSLSLYRSLSLSPHSPFARRQDTDKTHYLQHAPVTQIKDSQTRLIPSGWHSEIRRKSLSVNLALLAGLKAKQCTKTDLIRANTAVHF